MCLAIPGRLSAVTHRDGMKTGRTSFGGVSREISLDLVPEAEPGDYVLVHVGVAISRISEQEAERTLAVLREFGVAAEPE